MIAETVVFTPDAWTAEGQLCYSEGRWQRYCYGILLTVQPHRRLFRKPLYNVVRHSPTGVDEICPREFTETKAIEIMMAMFSDMEIPK